jgi:hypothetical protein
LAVTSGQITVGLTATIIDGTQNSNFKLAIHNADNTAKVYIGGPDVTITNGLGIEKLTTLQFNMYPLESLYAVSGKENHIIHWLKQV